MRGAMSFAERRRPLLRPLPWPIKREEKRPSEVAVGLALNDFHSRFGAPPKSPKQRLNKVGVEIDFAVAQAINVAQPNCYMQDDQ